jgi:hypothetical protein
MEAFEETVKEGTKRGSSFVDHVFRLDEQQQGVLLNIVQYTIIGFVPILVMLYLVRTYVPEPDDHKATLMILVEIIGQIIFMFVFIYFIHRLITYVPTYSGYRYSEFNFTTTILGILMILLSIKTKLGEKVQIIVDRTIDLLGGETSYNGTAGGSGAQGGTRWRRWQWWRSSHNATPFPAIRRRCSRWNDWWWNGTSQPSSHF